MGFQIFKKGKNELEWAEKGEGNESERPELGKRR
jgi:hypothetical protein